MTSTILSTVQPALVPTRFFQDGVITVTAVAQGNDIVAIDGLVGTGKTTCARYVANQLDRPCSIVTVPYRPAPLDLLRHISLALTGVRGSGTRSDMQNEILEHLDGWGGLLIVDELQYSQRSAMQELVYLYEESGRAFALAIVGAGVLDTVSHHPQLLSRIMGQVVFEPLVGDELIDALHELDARYARTARSILTQHDQAACHGLLRRWAATTNWLDRLGVEGPVTNEDLAEVRTKLPSMTRQPATNGILTRSHR